MSLIVDDKFNQCHVTTMNCCFCHVQWQIQGGDRPYRPPTQSGKIDLIQEEHVSTHVSQSESGSLTDLTRIVSLSSDRWIMEIGIHAYSLLKIAIGG